MKILLLSNYYLKQQSMQRFAELMREGLSAEGHEVRLVRPPEVFGRLCRSDTGLGKWIGYIDRFVLYPPILRMQVRWADIVHICDQANAVYIPYLLGKPHVLTCHDMLAIRAALGEIAESPTGWTGRLYQRWILRNMSKAQFVVCDTRQTGEEVQRLTGLSCERVAIVPLALNYPYYPMEKAEARACLNALGMIGPTPFFLHVGGNSWYKNRVGVIRIFAELLKHSGYQTHRLVMAGKPLSAEIRQLIHDLGVDEDVVELVEVSNKDLCALYSTAEALLFPSLAEGFGWPILEAQACDCMVITTSRSPMTEVSGGAAVFIDPAQVEQSAAAIASSRARRGELVQAGSLNARRYERQTMIDGYLLAYTSVIAPTRHGVSSPVRA
jgi:glycosyltransferase involved in cell wall biosynthesis